LNTLYGASSFYYLLRVQLKGIKQIKRILWVIQNEIVSQVVVEEAVVLKTEAMVGQICLVQHVQTVEIVAKFLLNQLGASQFIAVIVLKVKKVLLLDGLVEEIFEVTEKCLKQLVMIVEIHVKCHLNLLMVKKFFVVPVLIKEGALQEMVGQKDLVVMRQLQSN
jgi:hypothetical protein